MNLRLNDPGHFTAIITQNKIVKSRDYCLECIAVHPQLPIVASGQGAGNDDTEMDGSHVQVQHVIFNDGHTGLIALVLFFSK